MKLRPVTKLDKKRMIPPKKFDDDVMSANCVVIVFFPIMANLQPSGSRILDAWFIKFTFSLIVTIYLTKLENKTKKSLTQLSY